MTDLIQLNDDEVAAVAGGLVITNQANVANVHQNAFAFNGGNVVAANLSVGFLSGGNTVAAAGAEASNTLLFAQTNASRAINL
jgi:hypothetical protein